MNVRISAWRRFWPLWLCLLLCMAAGGLYVGRSQTESILAFQQRCNELSAEGKWEELAPLAKRWSEIEPQAADPWLFRANAAEGIKDWEAVAANLDRVPRTDPRAAAALVRKAIAEFEPLNRPWQGMQTCDEILELEPRVLIAHKQTIFFCAMTLQRAEMVRRIRRAISVRRESPESYIYLVGASWLYSGALYRHNTHWLKGDPDSELFQVAQAMQVYTSQAKSDLERSAEFEHIPTPEQMLERYPHNLELIAFLLSRTITAGDLEQVQSLLQRIPTEVADKDARFWRARAWCQDAAGELEQSEQSLRKSYALDRYWWQVHFQLHDLLRRLGRREESDQFLKIYQLSKELSTTIMTLNRTEDGFNDPGFSQSLLKLAEMIGDQDVSAALRERVDAR